MLNLHNVWISRSYFFCIFIIVTINFLFGVFLVRDVAFGDVAVFTTTFDLLNNQHALYTQTWDHKDFGFYGFGVWIYKILGVLGLQIFTLIQLITIALVLALSIRKAFNVYLVFLIACMFLTIVVKSGIFMAPAPDLWAVNFLTIAVLLMRKTPFFSGFLMALAFSIKITSIVPVLFIFLSYAYIDFISTKRLSKKFAKSLAAYFFTSISIIYYAYSSESLKGWIDTTKFNFYYSNISRGWEINLLDPIDQFVGIVRVLFGGYIYSGWFLPFTVFLILLMSIIIYFQRKKYNRSQILFVFRVFLPILALLTGAFIILVSQAPPSDTHYILLFVPLAVVGAIQFLLISTQFNNNLMAFPLVLVFSVCLIFVEDSVVKKNGTFKSSLTNGVLGDYLEVLPSDKSFAILTGNYFNVSNGNHINARLICRHHYILTHIYNYYKSEINNCVEKKPDYFFINEEVLKKQFSSDYSSLYEDVISKVKDIYYDCSILKRGFDVYSINTDNCMVFK